MKAADFRRIARSLTGVVEGAHMGHADFRAGGKKIFATLNAEETRGMVSLTPDEQAEFMRAHPATFTPVSGAWGRGGATMVELAVADEDVVGEAMTVAWQGANKKLEGKSGKVKGKRKVTKGDMKKRPKRRKREVITRRS